MNELIEKYFNGETTTEEEILLKTNILSEENSEFFPLFKAYENEKYSGKKVHFKRKRKNQGKSGLKILYSIVGIAASIILVSGIFIVYFNNNKLVASTNQIVIVNGKLITDEQEKQENIVKIRERKQKMYENRQKMLQNRNEIKSKILGENNIKIQ